MVKTSPLLAHSSTLTVDQLVNKLKATFKEKGVTLFSHIDHSAAAKQVGLDLRREEVLIFGSPKTGTALMEENPEIGVELPLKILIWQGVDGKTWIGYKDPLLLTDVYGIKAHADVLKKMSESLHQLINTVIGGSHE